MTLTKQDLQAIADIVDERLELKLEEKLDKKLKQELDPIRKDIAKLQKTLDMTIRSFDNEIMYNRKSIRRLEVKSELKPLAR